jgi:hypothetical protein
MKSKFTVLEKNIRKGLIFFGCMLFFTSMEAQITYMYDASGNRTKRMIIKSKSLSIDTVAYNQISDSIRDVSSDDPFAKKDAFEVKVYPNPTQGIIEIEIPELKANQKAQMRIYSITGSYIKQVQNLQKRQSINLTDLSSGIYLLYIMVDENTVVKKIVKQ